MCIKYSNYEKIDLLFECLSTGRDLEGVPGMRGLGLKLSGVLAECDKRLLDRFGCNVRNTLHHILYWAVFLEGSLLPLIYAEGQYYNRNHIGVGVVYKYITNFVIQYIFLDTFGHHQSMYWLSSLVHGPAHRLAQPGCLIH